MDHKASLSARTLWNAIGSAAISLGHMVSAVVVARQLGPEIAGKYAFLAVLAEITMLVVELGLPNAMTRFSAERAARGDLAGQTYVVRWAARRYIAPITIGSLAVFAGLTGYDRTTSLLAAMFLFSLCTYTFVQAYLAGVQDFRTLAKVNILCGLAMVVGRPVGALLFGLDGALAGNVAAYMISLSACGPIWRAATRPIEISPSMSSGVARYAFHAWLSVLVSAVAGTRMEIFFINRLSTHAQSGYYSAGLALYMGLVAIVTLMIGALTPHFSGLVGKGDTAGLRRDYRRLVVYVSLLIFPLSLGGAAVMPKLLPLLYGEAYAPAITAVAILIASAMLTVSGVASSMTYAYGKSHYILAIAILCAVIMVAGCMLLVPVTGAAGAAVARAIAQLASTAIGTAVLHLVLRIVPPYLMLAKIALAALFCALAARAAISYLPDALVLDITIGAIVYVGSLRVFGGIPQDDADPLVSTLSRLPRFAARYAVPVTRWILVCPK